MKDLDDNALLNRLRKTLINFDDYPVEKRTEVMGEIWVEILLRMEHRTCRNSWQASISQAVTEISDELKSLRQVVDALPGDGQPI